MGAVSFTFTGLLQSFVNIKAQKNPVVFCLLRFDGEKPAQCARNHQSEPHLVSNHSTAFTSRQTNSTSCSPGIKTEVFSKVLVLYWNILMSCYFMLLLHYISEILYFLLLCIHLTVVAPDQDLKS